MVMQVPGIRVALSPGAANSVKDQVLLMRASTEVVVLAVSSQAGIRNAERIKNAGIKENIFFMGLHITCGYLHVLTYGMTGVCRESPVPPGVNRPPQYGTQGQAERIYI